MLIELESESLGKVPENPLHLERFWNSSSAGMHTLRSTAIPSINFDREFEA